MQRVSFDFGTCVYSMYIFYRFRKMFYEAEIIDSIFYVSHHDYIYIIIYIYIIYIFKIAIGGGTPHVQTTPYYFAS